MWDMAIIACVCVCVCVCVCAYMYFVYVHTCIYVCVYVCCVAMHTIICVECCPIISPQFVDCLSYCACSDYQKTREQKKREDELLQELMELVNARDKLEQRKLAHEVM